jgi:uncharacterized protein (DUF427 family)
MGADSNRSAALRGPPRNSGRLRPNPFNSLYLYFLPEPFPCLFASNPQIHLNRLRADFAFEGRGAINMAKAIWGGKVIAESNNTVVVEGNQYFPPDSVTQDVLKSSSHTSICPWKGTAHYYHLEVDGMKNENAAWYYPEPNPAAAEIKGRIAFWKGVRVETGKN